jgi:3-deoxy-manno-octulosonate cytidylyltransferase (CMP-KDO synthetase)
MIVRVAQRAHQSAAVRCVVAADSLDIVQACNDHGIEAILTRMDHPSGSDRLAEACAHLDLPDDHLVINVQGDEPLMDPALINAVAQLLAQHPDASMSTAANAITDIADFCNPNTVKLVLDARNMALYFSRAPIPWWRDGATQNKPALPTPAALRHIGIYGYRVQFLRQFPNLPPAPVESCESLEQLRALWHGYRIAVHIAHSAPGPGVDTPQDLARVQELFAKSGETHQH